MCTSPRKCAQAAEGLCVQAFTINVPQSEHSQDRVATVQAAQAFYVLLADGAGGTSGGAEAAEFFVCQLLERAKAATLETSHLWDIDLALEARPECGETTGLYLAISDTELIGSSVGDSQAWLVSGSGIHVLTADQNRKPLLGSGRASPAPFRVPRSAGTLLVASDGLFNYTTAAKIQEALRDGARPQTLDALVNLVRLRTGGLQDDISIALVDL